jgi:hypothetical protein
MAFLHESPIVLKQPDWRLQHVKAGVRYRARGDEYGPGFHVVTKQTNGRRFVGWLAWCWHQVMAFFWWGFCLGYVYLYYER